ncbi:hypothetical protein [Rheinheimera sp. 4Y26]|uniref:hypothetical protein n=1 Tax=Rheinheimera sp. 4Y26 TaxID=2977811 RepID=UPI0021B11339|nr:hypothetical protein [Rheinheimera sp. 4Y26]MCT6700802.1 hypothetical protein [Rheinheimera sp. 4Y26]
MKLNICCWLLATSLLAPVVAVAEQALTGQWIRDMQQQTLTDPQTSGLTWRHDELISLGDQSANPALRMKLFRINAKTAAFNHEPVPITISDKVRSSCFGDYLVNSPDLEALTWDRIDDKTLITVTEDASRAQLSPACGRKYAQTNSTTYPTLLLKISLNEDFTKAEITAVRPVQFPQEAQVGNLPNDGIEGLAVDDHQNLYLALEKNSATKPAIFKTRLTADFWAKDNFVKVIDANLTLPPLDNKGHPINGIDFLPSPIPGHPGYLVAVARNDDQLWIFDLTNRVMPFVQPLSFYVGTDHSGLCPVYEKMVQTALEGVAVKDGRVYLVNDPWKQHYPDNIQCDVNAAHFQNMSPLLFQLEVDPRWFTLARPKLQTAVPGISAMAQIDADRYLLVQDKKIDQSGDRLGVLQLSNTGQPSYQSVFVTGWPNNQPASDLESACALPGRPNEFLIGESGSWHGEFGRLFHIRLYQGYANVLATFPLPLERDNTTELNGDNFEGLVCVSKAPNRYLLILGERGGDGLAGSLVWGEFDLAAGAIHWQPGRIAVQAPQPEKAEPKQRDIADLYLESNVLWASAVREAGDGGPFSSFIYQLALIDPQAAVPVNLIGSSKIYWQVDGFKVEALAPPSPLLPGSSLAIGTEDEWLHGQWRALFPPVGQSAAIPSQPPAASDQVKSTPTNQAPVTDKPKS